MRDRNSAASRPQLCLRLMKYVAPYWEVLVPALAGMVVMGATMPMLAVLVQLVLDGVLSGKNLELMQVVLLGIFGLFAVRGVAGYVGTYAISWAGAKLEMDLRLEMFNKLLMGRARYYANHEDRALISHITSGTTQLAHAFRSVVTVMVKDTIAMIGLLLWMFYLDWKLTLLAISVASAILMMRRIIIKWLQERALEAEQTMGGLSQVLQQSIENYMVIKLYGGEQYENQRMREQAEKVHRKVTGRMSIEASVVLLMQIVIAMAVAIVVYVASQQAHGDKITAGGFVSLVAAGLMLIVPSRRIAGVNKSLQHGLMAARNVFLFLDQEIEPDAGTIAIESPRGELRFENVTFRPDHGVGSNTGLKPNLQPGPEACSGLRDITLTVLPGEMVALVGSPETKAALVSLVSRFLYPASGKVLLDGHDLKDFKLACLRAHIALVSAETVFSDTIAANIAYGATGRATEARITAAAHAAHASEFIRKMPQGLQTIMGEQGQKLSGDQLFRIAIARALLKNPPILILDETFQIPNSDSANHVRAALETLTQGRTTLVIASSLCTLEKADQVVVLDRDGIVESGSHQELLARDVDYARFVETLCHSKGEIVE